MVQACRSLHSSPQSLGPVPPLPEKGGKVRHGIFPEELFTLLYPKTGVTGNFLLLLCVNFLSAGQFREPRKQNFSVHTTSKVNHWVHYTICFWLTCIDCCLRRTIYITHQSWLVHCWQNTNIHLIFSPLNILNLPRSKITSYQPANLVGKRKKSWMQHSFCSDFLTDLYFQQWDQENESYFLLTFAKHKFYLVCVFKMNIFYAGVMQLCAVTIAHAVVHTPAEMIWLIFASGQILPCGSIDKTQQIIA